MADKIGNGKPREPQLYAELEIDVARIYRKQLPADSENYVKSYADVVAAQQASVICDHNIHYSLYGIYQGRDYLHKLKQGVKNIIVISPSHLKQCGIGEYGRYLSETLAATGRNVIVERTSGKVLELDDSVLEGALILVNHGPGLFDGLNPRLSQGESTTQLVQNLETLAFEKGGIPVILHHSLINTDQHLLYSRQAQLLSSRIAQITFISAGARHFFLIPAELGVSPVAMPEDFYDSDRVSRHEIIGFFGFFQYGGKDFDALIHAAKELRATLVGSVATVNQSEVEKLEEILDSSGIEHDFATGWCDDSELMDRLSVADYFYLPQNDYDHWNNSATARFVANLARPIFLPPHQPFHDMEDGAIFAGKWDLPRIIAAVREPRMFDQAVERVAAFRRRASMTNTASLICEQLVGRLVQSGSDLLLGPAETSLERYLELDAAKQDGMLTALGCADESELLNRVRAFRRAPPALQFWRKHYELGDLVGVPTVLESIHASWLAICKRYPDFETIQASVAEPEAFSHTAEPIEAAVRKIIVTALKSRGGTFHTPSILFLNGGDVDNDALSDDKIRSFLEKRKSRLVRMREMLDAAQPADMYPPVDNLLELLVIPPDHLSGRPAPFDLKRLDLKRVHEAQHPQERFNRLVAAASEAGIQLSKSIVLDHLVPKEIQPRVSRYCLEDFIYLDGDFFILHAVRCILKRNAFPIELMVLQKLTEACGKATVLKYLLLKSDNLIQIAGLDAPDAPRLKMDEFSLFMANARDPLFGLFDLRNRYEMQRRHNERWWIATKAASDAIWASSGSNFKAVLDVYRLLDVPIDVDARAKDANSYLSNYMTPDGRIIDLVYLSKVRARVSPGVPLHFNRTATRETLAALHGFHAAEEPGAWVDGRSGQISLRLAGATAGPSGNRVIVITLGLFGSVQLGPRTLSAYVYLSSNADSAWITLRQKVLITTEEGVELRIPIPQMRSESFAIVDLEISNVISPQAAGVSADPRRLGMLLRRISIEDVDGPEGDLHPNANAGFLKSLTNVFR